MISSRFLLLAGVVLLGASQLPAQVTADRIRRADAEPHNWLT